MKNFVLPALFWALAISQLIAQKTLSPSVAQYSSNLTYSVKKMLNAVGYKLPAAEVQSDVKQAVEGRSADLQLDSTVTYYNYDPSGQMDSLPLFRTVFTHPTADQEVQEESVFENNAWVPLNRSFLMYDDQNRIVNTYSELYDPGTSAWLPDSKMEVYPHGNSPDQVDSMFVLGWSADENSWLGLLSVWNEFDLQERLTVSLSLLDLFGQPIIFKDVYSYNISGENTLIESYLVDAGIEYFAGKQDFFYQEHHLVKELAFASDGFGGFEQQYQITYNYSPSWILENQATYNWDLENSEWWVAEAIFYEYDDEGRLASMETTHATQDGEAEHQLITYEYREGEYLALESNFSYDFTLENYVLSDRKYYYYAGDLSGVPFEPKSIKSLVMFPNPTSGSVQFKLDDVASVQVFDHSGKMVQGFSALPGNANLDLVMLPAGIYEVKVIAGKDVYASRIVKQ